jgi:branched-chain amino acid transport system ATP-binding protein
VILLKTIGLTHYFGGLRALSRFNIELAPGELVGLIGPNGAGKTTAFNLISGIYKPSSGRVFIDGIDITGLPAYRINRLGISRTFQNIRLFHDMSCIDNIKVASRMNLGCGFFSSLFHRPSFWEQEHRLDDYCYGLLKMFNLHAYANQKAASLPYGPQRRLEIARALATQPKLLLLDEPAAGMNPAETRDLIETIRWIKNEFMLTILIIEHNMHLIMNISERILVMDFGETIASDVPDRIRSDPKVIAAYLGKLEGHVS